MTVKIIGISGSPRKGGNTEILVKEALKGAEEVKDVEVSFVTLAGKKIYHCTGCLSCDKQGGMCVVKDDFIDFFEAYMEADGIILGSPVYHLSITSVLKAAIDRLGSSMSAIYKGKTPRLCKAAGVITQGNSIYGGQEFTLQFMIGSFILENCLVVSGDKPQSKIGIAASTFGDSSRGSIHKNENALVLSRSVGKRVAEMSRILKMGIRQLRSELGPEYFLRNHLDCLQMEKKKREAGEHGKI